MRVKPFRVSFPVALTTALLGLLATYFYFESTEKYFFLQDDNFAAFFPVTFRALENFWTTGIFPFWLPNLALGIPVTALGTYGITYPVMHVAFLIATFVLRDPLMTINIYFLLHGLPAIVLISYFLRRQKVPAWLACFSALNFVLIGYFTIGGRSWYYMIPWMFWIPAVFWMLMEAPETLSIRYGLKLAALMGISFYAGNIQMWGYLVLFAVAYVAIRNLKHFSIPLSTNYLIGFVGGVVVALPLFCLQWSVMKDLRPLIGGGGNISYGFFAVFFPYPLVQVHDNGSIVNLHREWMGHTFYFNTLFSVIAISLPVAMLFRPSLQKGGYLEFGLLLILSLLLAMGDHALLWSVLTKIPPFKYWSHASKFLPFVHFFTLVLAAFALTQWLQRKPKIFHVVTFFTAALFLVLHISHSTFSFFNYGERTYDLSKNMGPVTRLRSSANHKSAYSHYTQSQHHNFAAYHDLIATSSYDPILRRVETWAKADELELENPPAFWRAYGVSHHLFSEDATAQFRDWRAYKWLRKDGLILNDVPNLVIVRDPKADPLVFVEGSPKANLNVKLIPNGIEASNLPSGGGELVMGFLWSEGFWTAQTDTGNYPTFSDKFGRIRATFPPESKTISIRYSPPWMAILPPSAVALLLYSIALLFLAREWISFTPRKRLNRKFAA